MSASTSRRALVVPGIVAFVERIHYDDTPEWIRTQTLEHIGPGLGSHGYALEEAGADELRFAWRRRPGWTILAAILAFPVGLLALLYKDTERISIRFEASSDATWMLAHGVAPLAVRRGFAQLHPAPEPPDLRAVYLSGS